MLFTPQLNDTRAAFVVDLLRYGKYVDTLTERLTLRLPLYNADAALWSLTTLVWSSSPSGAFDFEFATVVVDLDCYYSAADSACAFVELLLLAVIAGLLLRGAGCERGGRRRRRRAARAHAR